MKAQSKRPIVTLTTDFGTADHYAGTMKGVLLTRCPGVEIVDISHEIPPFSIHAGAYTIDQAASYFPAQTLHVVVVDPGVGTPRKPLLVEALGQYFIAPDNGVLSMVANRVGKIAAREITNRHLWSDMVSSTFHGRDIFAPVAASIAGGQAKPKDVGPKLAEIVRLRDLQPRERKPGDWQGTLLSIDHFGNVITNFPCAAFGRIASWRFNLRIGRHRIDKFHRTFGAASSGECFAYFGSSRFIEIGMNQRSAASFLRTKPGDPVTLALLDLLK